MPTKADTPKPEDEIRQERCGGSISTDLFGVCPFADAVSRRIAERAAMGKEKYGVTCERTDLDMKAWMTHLQEELMDACVYIERAKYELWRSTEDSSPNDQSEGQPPSVTE